MPFFEKSQNTIINGGQFTDNSIINYNYGQSGIDIIREASIPDAAVDAEARKYSPRCFPGTREQYIEDIVHWAAESSDYRSPCIYWMSGPAGVGKSAIAQTCAERMKDIGQLGAAFFFSINGRNDPTRFFTTIAYQLSTVLPEYKDILNKRVFNDKTIVQKTMATQYKTLIIEPLQEMKAQGREVGSHAIFIDGLDECQSTDAQVEIIELIAASVRNYSTHLRWAFFSRAEAHIEATFSLNNIGLLCRRVVLPISRDTSGEIQLYLEGGFQNILRLRNLSFPKPWPSPEAICKLVDASAGLFAYPATVLRFIDFYPSADLQEPLNAVLAAICSPSNDSAISPFAELDAFYMFILRRIPDHILPSVKLFFALLFEDYHSNDPLLFDIAPWFNQLGLSEAMFNNMRNHLHAVVQFQDSSEAFHFEAGINLKRPYHEQINPSLQTRVQIDESLGLVSFYHKSFYDFLADPARSFAYCATGSEMQLKLFDHRLEFHSHYASSYMIKGSDLLLAPGLADSGATLSFPLDNEYVNSYMKDIAFFDLTVRATRAPGPDFFTKIPLHSLRELREVDYRKFLLTILNLNPGVLGTGVLWGSPAWVWGVRKTQFSRLDPECIHSFNFKAFFSMIGLFKKEGIIEPYHLTLTSRWTHFFRRICSGSERSGLYILGRAEKAVFWYWELDTASKEYSDFLTLDLAAAIKLYEEVKERTWNRG